MRGDIAPLLVDGEDVVSAFKGARDFVAFTNRRVIAVNVQGRPGPVSPMPYGAQLPMAEAVIVTRDVCRLDPEDATELMVWTATTLVRSAMQPPL